jgi:hypothetical protein
VLVGLMAAIVLEVRRRLRQGRPEPTVAPWPEPARPAPAASVPDAPVASARPEPAAAESPPVVEQPELDRQEVARIVGCTQEEVSALLDGRPATRERAEELASQHYRWRRHVDDPDSYWVTLKQASAIRGVSTQRMKQLLDSGEVPFVVHRDGVRLMRRDELSR